MRSFDDESDGFRVDLREFSARCASWSDELTGHARGIQRDQFAFSWRQCRLQPTKWKLEYIVNNFDDLNGRQQK